MGSGGSSGCFAEVSPLIAGGCGGVGSGSVTEGGRL
jgi:hypothetical protein